MNDPYKVLGVSPNADEKEIKSAYKQLVRKYHPDKFQDDTMSELANEKMTEINAAYDQIMDERKKGSSYGSSYGSSSGGYSSSSGSYGSSSYQSIRMKIQAGNLGEADAMLNVIPQSQRNGEWYFLKGMICYNQGWINEAYSNISMAVQMDPSNAEYRSALNQMNAQRGGYMAGNSYQSSSTSSTDTCSCLESLCIADCCCECMGGDLIPCC